jgi:hypothetical protein
MSTKKLQPICSTKNLVSKDGEILIPRYMIGNPRSYRLDLGKGVLNLEGRQQITKPGQGFKVIPIAFRCLQDGLFGQPEKKWCEVYFLNEAGHLSVFMFHDFSVNNLSEAARDLFYENRGLCEVVWNIRLEQKQNKDGAKYYMAFFEFEMINEEDLKIWKTVYQNILDKHSHIYRSDTVDSKTLFFENWSDGKTLTEKEIEDEKQRTIALIEEFSSNGESVAA